MELITVDHRAARKCLHTSLTFLTYLADVLRLLNPKRIRYIRGEKAVTPTV